jgi:hypothetical protein
MTTPAGFAPVFAGWNVWDVWQADDPTFSIMNAGLSLDRQLQIWVENEIKDNANGAAVADPANPAALRGDQIQLIPKVLDLTPVATRGSIPELAGALNVGSSGSKATLRTVRFFNRGTDAVLPWPHDENYVLDTVYQPDAANLVTSGPAPSSLAGAATAAADSALTVIKVVAVVAGVALLAMAVAKLADTRRAVA